MRVVVGLGNPGVRYERTRHNAGFRVVDRLAVRWAVRFDSAPGLRAGMGRLRSRPVLLVKPMRYMNRSGEALTGLDRRWKTEDLAVVHDDIDLAVGQLRIRNGGGTGGHRGIASLVASWGAEFDRVRIGVGRPPVGDAAAKYVLEVPSEGENAVLDEAVECACDAVECLLLDGIQQAMNRFNAPRSAGAR